MDPTFTSVLTIVGSGIAAYYGAYFRKRGEDKAIADGFAEVLRQTTETTKVTKAIEAKVGDEVWDRQKRWEMKRDLIFETTKKIGTVKDKLVALCNTYEAADQTGNPSQRMLEAYRQAEEQCDEAMNALEQNGALINLTCDEDVKNTVFEFCFFVRNCSREIVNGRAEVFRRSIKAFGEGLDAVMGAMRKEIGMAGTATASFNKP